MLNNKSFLDVTSTAGSFFTGRSYGAGAWGNLNGDDYPDLWVNNHFGPAENLYNRNLFLNNGDGTFTDVVADVFLPKGLMGDFHGSAWADFDNDGDQDLIQLVGGEKAGTNLPPDSGPNRLYVNEGGQLRDQARKFNLAYDSAKAQAPIWFDYDNDGRLDLFHGSTKRPDRLNPTTVFRQKENGVFEDVGVTVLPANFHRQTIKFGGLADLSNAKPPDLVVPGAPEDVLDISTIPFTDITEVISTSGAFSFAQDVAFGDFNNDLLMDVYIPRNTEDRLLFNTPQGLKDAKGSAGISSVDNSKGRGVVAADFDNDMDLDIFVVRGSDGSTNLPNILYDNQGDGTFVAVANAGGVLPSAVGIGDNATTADYDVDGFVDLFVTNGPGAVSNGPQQLFRNQGNDHNWLQIDLEGVASNRDGIGAKVFVTAGGVTQRRDQDGGVHRWSQNYQRLHFGLANNTQIESIEIFWPSGTKQVIENVTVNQVLKVTETDTGGGSGGNPNPSTLRIEAEDYITGGQGVGYFDTSSGNAGGAYRNDDVDIAETQDEGGGFNVGYIRDGEWLAYDVDVVASGEYDLVARVATPKSGTRRLSASIDGETTTVSFGSTGGWQSWQDVTIGSFDLSAGAQPLRVDFDKGSFNLNYLDLILTETDTGGGSGGNPNPSSLRIEAEDYITGGQGIGYFDTSSGNAGGAYRNDDVDIVETQDEGGGFNVGWIRDGEWLTYDVDVVAGGEYNLVARVATPKSGTRRLSASIDGETTTVSFGSTGGWQSWQDVTIGSFDLSAGAQPLRVDFDKGSFNINYLELVPI